jgi:ribosomal protein S18 acetylase RimI-like enzyme
MIEKTVIKDVSELCVLINSAYRGEISKKGWTTEANMLEGIRIDENELIGIIKQPNANIFKFIENRKIISCVLLDIQESKLYLGMLCVNPELQNNGIGKKMLDFAVDYALKNNLPKIIMTVISERLELISWYNRNGFYDNGTREPFPENHIDDVISGEKLEFIVLEKSIQ